MGNVFCGKKEKRDNMQLKETIILKNYADVSLIVRIEADKKFKRDAIIGFKKTLELAVPNF